MPLYQLSCPLLLLLLVAGPFVSAQMAAGPASSVVFSPRPYRALQPALTSVTPDTVRPGIRPTYWKEGAIVGGVAGGVSIGFLGYVACGLSEQPGRNCLGMTLLGGLFGAALPYPAPSLEGPSPRRRAGQSEMLPSRVRLTASSLSPAIVAPGGCI